MNINRDKNEPINVQTDNLVPITITSSNPSEILNARNMFYANMVFHGSVAA